MVRIGNNRQAEDGGAAKRARARVEAAASGTAGRCRTGAAPKKAQHLNMHRT